jgi:acyl transferase domain-containing protein/acyl carrier protein
VKSANSDLPLTSNSEAKRTFQVDTSSQQAIQAWLVSRLSALLRIDASLIDIREPFASYGMGSTEAVSLSGELADWLGRSVSADLAYEFPTVESLAQHLAGNPGASETSASPTNSGDTDTDRIAIIGIGCRVAGANSPQAFWKLLSEGVDAITEVPAQRFKVDAYYDSDPASPGKINTRWGGFIDNVDRFDSHFFGISPREAARMDPQQRLLLEVTWEALEDAGAVPEQLTGTRTGVFIGISNNDYGRNQLGDLRNIDAYAGTGNALSIAANRISYVFDFRGPSIAVDTACSSSLVAVHLACSSLRNGESTLAIAGGVNLILSPSVTINFTKAGVMAPDGRCKAFDSRANGYVRGEGVGVVVLKRLAQAIADGDPIYAVIHGSAVNQDGRSNGLMAPNPLAQESVLRDAYEHAGIAPGRVQYIEAHGTGTLLGDPIEAKALGKVLAIDRPSYAPCTIGSVKTNIGHLEAAAGIAGLIKTALALKWRQLPASLHFEEPNPLIPFDDLGLRVPTTSRPWPAPLGEALAGVSSFGFGGTNAHVVLGEAPPPGLGDTSHSNGTSADESHAHPTQILTLSARSPDALQALARSYREFLSASADTALGDICYTANARRGHLDYRLALVGDSQDRMIGGLGAFFRGESSPASFVGKRISSRKRKLVFVFPGQGSQWFGMGRELFQHYPAFRDMIIECDHALRPYCEWSLIGELNVTDPAKSRMGEIDVLQPMLFAIQMGLAALWRSWGIAPDAAVGHSMGEIAAACAVGALTLQDAARVICERSRLLKSTIGQGAMASVELSPADAQQALLGYEDRLAIALNNGPTSTVLSGDPAALMEVIGKLQARDVYCRIIKVDFAAHSPQMVPLQAELSHVLSDISPRTTSTPIYSTVTGKLLDGCEFTGSYWACNLREPVLFATAVQRVLADGYDTFIELSPNPSLLGAIQQAANHLTLECARLPSMRREKSETAVMLNSLGELYALGSEVNWRGVYPKKEQCVTLPSYPWQSERHWLDVAVSSEGEQASIGTPSENIDDCLYELLWQPDQGQKIASTTASSGGAWLIFADESGICEALATRLEGEGQRCVRVNAGDAYEQTDCGHFRIDPRQPEHFRQLCASAFPPDEPGCRGIVHLWSLDTASTDETTASSLEIAQTLGCYSILHLVQQIAGARWPDPPRLWIVTRGAQTVSAESAPPSISQAPVWGLGRVIAQEHPSLWGGLVDLDPAAPSIGASVDLLWQQISQVSCENQVAFRQGQRYVARLARRERSD